MRQITTVTANEMNERADGSPHHATSGRYANYFEIGHNAFEFLVDFGHATPDNATPAPHTRVVMSPGIAREFLKVLGIAVARYERDQEQVRADEAGE